MIESHMNPQQIADAVAFGMMAKYQASRGLGLRVTHISPGSAQIEMKPASAERLAPRAHRTAR